MSVGRFSLFLVTITLMFSGQVLGSFHAHRDVCIIGGGIGGFSVAVFLKDKGYNPLIIEKKPVVGGNCNSVEFTPPAPGDAHAIDIGAIAFANTTFLTQAGFGGWSIDSQAFFERFVGPDGLIPVPIPLLASEVMDVDLTTGQPVTPPPTNLTELGLALSAYILFLAERPYLTDFLNKPDPIPAELLVPFSQYIVENNLEVLVPLFRAVIAGGTTDLSSLSMWEALRMAINIEGMISIVSSGPSVFSVKNGCINLYNGMIDYLGAENVLTNVDLEFAIRPPAGFDFPSTLAGVITSTGHHGETIQRPFVQSCEKVFVAFPPLLSALEFLGPDEVESALFSSVSHFNYYVTSAEVEGPLVSNPPKEFMMVNYQEGKPYGLPAMPCLVNMFRGYPYGPATVGMTSANPIPVDEMIAIAQREVDTISDSLLTKVTLSTANAQAHVFEPYFPSSELATSPTAYTRLNNLQGYRNTYYSGSLLSTVSHVLIINWANGFIEANFPPKVPAHGH